MPHFGVPELLVILAVVLIILGPKRLPQLGRAIGRAITGFRREARNTPSSAGQAEGRWRVSAKTAAMAEVNGAVREGLRKRLIAAIPRLIFRVLFRRFF